MRYYKSKRRHKYEALRNRGLRINVDLSRRIALRTIENANALAMRKFTAATARCLEEEGENK